MLRFFALLGLLVGASGCAAPVPPAANPAAPAARAGPPAEQGTIVAMRPVAANDPGPVRRLLRGLGATLPAAGAAEFIVRADDGTTLSVVQPAEAMLHRGVRVAIERGAQTRISTVPDIAAARQAGPSLP